METWSAHHLFEQAAKLHDAKTCHALRSYAQRLTANGLPVVFTLGHLARITGVPYRMLRETVNRQRESANYRMYAVKKRSGGRRLIHSVSADLFRVQRFINQAILQSTIPHTCSFAFHRSGGIRACAAMHCGARWLFQYDLKDFFYDVNEIDVYRIFQEMGYRNLLAFELSKLCTTTHLPMWQKRLLYHDSESDSFDLFADGTEKGQFPYNDRSGNVGVLPQGAPTSPMLSNLAAKELDTFLHEYAMDHGFVYTRYADDITISSADNSSVRSKGEIHRSIVRRIRRARFRENEKKTRIAGPGSKKVVLGLLVDGEVPRLSRDTYRRVDRLLYAAKEFGWEATATHHGFDSAFGFHNHLSGLVRFVHDVDLKRWTDFSERLSSIPVPWHST